MPHVFVGLLFFFNDAPATEIYTLSLQRRSSDLAAVQTMAEHDIGSVVVMEQGQLIGILTFREIINTVHTKDRKSTRLNSSHLGISYAVFCLKKKKTQTDYVQTPTQHNGRTAKPA